MKQQLAFIGGDATTFSEMQHKIAWLSPEELNSLHQKMEEVNFDDPPRDLCIVPTDEHLEILNLGHMLFLAQAEQQRKNESTSSISR
jgi:hypothetical protein